MKILCREDLPASREGRRWRGEAKQPTAGRNDAKAGKWGIGFYGLLTISVLYFPVMTPYDPVIALSFSCLLPVCLPIVSCCLNRGLNRLPDATEN
jgi:hypothetical protein